MPVGVDNRCSVQKMDTHDTQAVGDRDLKENLQLHSHRWDFLKITVMWAHDWMEMLIWEAKRVKPCGVFGQKVVTNPAEADFSMLNTSFC